MSSPGKLWCIWLTGLVIVHHAAQTDAADTSQQAVWQHGVVSADHPAASEAGAEILRRGGNVVDAAVATSFALSVVRPASCGVGGGGFMLIWNAEQQHAVALDYRERAPLSAHRDMFAQSDPTSGTESESVRGGKAVAVPGTVAGLCMAAEKYGSLPLPTLLEPALQLAREGVLVDEHHIAVQQATLAVFERHPDYARRFEPLLIDYLNHGRAWQPGDRYFSPQKKLLERLAAEGPAAFYAGSVSAAIIDSVRQAGGIMNQKDLSEYRPVEREPLKAGFHGAEVLSMPPASSGGVALIQTLQTLEQWEQLSSRSLKSLRHNSDDYIHVVSEAMKHAFADRAEFLGDSDFSDLPLSRLLSIPYARHTAEQIDLQSTLPPAKYGRFFCASDGGTSHFSVIDREGNAVACTETINLTFGSFLVVPEYGVVLNNEIDDFAAKPGQPNAFGLMQSEANAIAPGKKPLSSMTPTIVVRDGKAVLAAGASGGPRIISATIQTTLNQMIFDMGPAAAVSAPRFHHQWFPNELLLEPTLFDTLSRQMQTRGHRTIRRTELAASQSASRTDSGLQGGSDPRKHGRPAGF